MSNTVFQKKKIVKYAYLAFRYTCFLKPIATVLATNLSLFYPESPPPPPPLQKKNVCNGLGLFP